MLDRSNPLITEDTQERNEYDGQLRMNWVVASQLISSDNVIQERRFVELEHLAPLRLDVLSGRPTGSDSASNYHYQLKREFVEHSYRSQRIFAQEGDLAQFNDFKGWQYLANVYLRTEFWVDDLSEIIVWQLRSKPAPDQPAQDIVVRFNGAGNQTQLSTISESTIQTFNVGARWGIRTEASGNFQFEMRGNNETLIQTFNKDWNYNIPSNLAEGLQSLPTPAKPNEAIGSISPKGLTHPIIKIVAPTVDRTHTTAWITPPGPGTIDPITGEPIPPTPVEVTVIKVLAEVHLFLYGQYWLQEMKLANIYEQNTLVHPENTPLSMRLKPPGKSYFSDSFINDTEFTSNAEAR